MRLARALLYALWAGVLVTLGALVAPALFQTLPDRHLAGAVAGTLFRIAAELSVALALLLLAPQLGHALWRRLPAPRATEAVRPLAALGPALVLVVSQFAVRPFVEGYGAGAGLAPGTVFALWHTLSSALYWGATIWVLTGLVRELRGAARAR